MPSPQLILGLLITVSACLSTGLAGWHNSLASTGSDKSPLTVLMGDSRRIFAEHFYAKADVYFHSGYYPSIFDAPKRAERSHMEGAQTVVKEAEAEHGKEAPSGEHHEHDETCDHEAESAEEKEAEFLDKPRDIIDSFGRNFFITQHSHLETGEQREMLPWLKVAAELDPQKVQTYTVASYWLRSRLNKPIEAEQFLREGLRANPHSYEILFELGRIQKENHSKPDIARNLWELAIAKWKLQQAAGLKPSEFNYEQILGFLASLEEEQGNLPKAIRHFEELKEFSPAREAIEKRIADLKQKVAASP